jgi:uncharacterized membrane protein YciS (DUF1049 family)
MNRRTQEIIDKIHRKVGNGSNVKIIVSRPSMAANSGFQPSTGLLVLSLACLLLLVLSIVAVVFFILRKQLEDLEKRARQRQQMVDQTVELIKHKLESYFAAAARQKRVKAAKPNKPIDFQGVQPAGAVEPFLQLRDKYRDLPSCFPLTVETETPRGRLTFEVTMEDMEGEWLDKGPEQLRNNLRLLVGVN